MNTGKMSIDEIFKEDWDGKSDGEIFLDMFFASPGEFVKPTRTHRVTKAKLDSFLDELTDSGWDPGLTEDSYKSIIASGITSKNRGLAAIAAGIAVDEQPLTLRGLFYRVVSVGALPSTDQKHYTRLGRLLTRLREARVIPFGWIVDNLRNTEKPSSWTGLNDFVDTVRDSYRKDFWSSLPEYVHVFCEKDAIAGTLSPVTREFDVPLSPIRGYVSLSYANEIAEQWSRIDKPIFAYYVGDFDPSGFDLERDLKDKLGRYSESDFTWCRLGVNAEDFNEFDLISLTPKKTDRRCQSFIDKHGTQCTELDAIPANALRQRIREAIEAHIPNEEWERLLTVEQAERETFERVMDSFGGEA